MNEDNNQGRVSISKADRGKWNIETEVECYCDKYISFSTQILNLCIINQFGCSILLTSTKQVINSGTQFNTGGKLKRLSHPSSPFYANILSQQPTFLSCTETLPNIILKSKYFMTTFSHLSNLPVQYSKNSKHNTLMVRSHQGSVKLQ